MTGAAREPSDAILTVPNIITFCRLALIPPFLWLALGAGNDLAGWVTGFVLAGSDYLDGIVARRFGQVSRLGILLDPLSDRLAVGAGAAVLIARDLAPLWAVVAVLARDGLLLLAAPLVRARGLAIPPVTRTGKLGTFLVMWSFGTFYAAVVPDPPWGWVRGVAWGFYWPGIALGYAAAAGYARTLARAERAPGIAG